VRIEIRPACMPRGAFHKDMKQCAFSLPCIARQLP
jgi:hypothetical protein